MRSVAALVGRGRSGSLDHLLVHGLLMSLCLHRYPSFSTIAIATHNSRFIRSAALQPHTNCGRYLRRLTNIQDHLHICH
jgi:hypothetical protein